MVFRYQLIELVEMLQRCDLNAPRSNAANYVECLFAIRMNPAANATLILIAKTHKTKCNLTQSYYYEFLNAIRLIFISSDVFSIIFEIIFFKSETL